MTLTYLQTKPITDHFTLCVTWILAESLVECFLVDVVRHIPHEEPVPLCPKVSALIHALRFGGVGWRQRRESAITHLDPNLVMSDPPKSCRFLS
jgi:hypothetical protein